MCPIVEDPDTVRLGDKFASERKRTVQILSTERPIYDPSFCRDGVISKEARIIQMCGLFKCVVKYRCPKSFGLSGTVFPSSEGIVEYYCLRCLWQPKFENSKNV
jgi:hypothetical protein